MPPSHRTARLGVAVLAVALLTGCTTSHRPVAMTVTPELPAPSAVELPSAPPLPALKGPRLRPDVLVTGALTPREVSAVRKVSPSAVLFAIGTARIGKAVVSVATVDPVSFRRFAASGTAESTPLWQVVASGQLIASHALAHRLHLPLGGVVVVGHTRLRLGGLATTGIPGTDLVVDKATGIRLGVARKRAVLLTAGTGDPETVASKVRRATGSEASVELLTQPASSPIAFLTGSRAARAFGAFSYTYHEDGTIEPDARWVAANIATGTVPILGTVTCHRLLFPQLRGALQQVVDEGLAGTIHTYNGCYVPRFIERDPSHPVSLHTWGIAIDIDASTNGRGGRGTMNPRVVQIFKHWGFRWGGDWSYTDPMHFELGALLKNSA